MTVVAAMAAGADSIDDVDRLRHTGMQTMFRGIRAPSTVGTLLRSFTHGHALQLLEALLCQQLRRRLRELAEIFDRQRRRLSTEPAEPFLGAHLCWAHPARQYKNPNLLVNGPEVAVKPTHTKIRRNGYLKS